MSRRGGGAAANVADGIDVARGKLGDLPVGHTGLVNEIEEALSEAHARIRSGSAVSLTCSAVPAEAKACETQVIEAAPDLRSPKFLCVDGIPPALCPRHSKKATRGNASFQ